MSDTNTHTNINSADGFRAKLRQLVVEAWNHEETKAQKMTEKEKKIMRVFESFPKNTHTDQLLQLVNVITDSNLSFPSVYKVGDLLLYNGYTCAVFGRVGQYYYSVALIKGNPQPMGYNLGDGNSQAVSRDVAKAHYEDYLRQLDNTPFAKILACIAASFGEPGLNEFFKNVS